MGFPGRPWVHGGGSALRLTSSYLAVKKSQIVQWIQYGVPSQTMGTRWRFSITVNFKQLGCKKITNTVHVIVHWIQCGVAWQTMGTWWRFSITVDFKQLGCKNSQIQYMQLYSGYSVGFPGRQWVHGGGSALRLTSSNLAVKIRKYSTCNCTVDTV